MSLSWVGWPRESLESCMTLSWVGSPVLAPSTPPSSQNEDRRKMTSGLWQGKEKVDIVNYTCNFSVTDVYSPEEAG